jgi:uncharacterized protein YndB with AHSA1/START domain
MLVGQGSARYLWKGGVMRIEESIVINRQPTEVFGYLADREHDAVWMGSVVESEWLDGAAPLSVGRRGRMVFEILGRQTETVDEVSEFVPGERIAHRTVQGTFLLNTACLTRPEGAGTRTTVVAEAGSLVGGRGWFANPLMASLMRRGFRADLRRLKKILEAEIGTQSKVRPARPVAPEGRG